MMLESIFINQQPIPVKYTCEGLDVSPPLRFINVPSGSKSLVLIVEDPDAPKGTFDHWLVWNIPPQVKEVSEGAAELFDRYKQVRQGLNGYNTADYRGPCPPPGKVHHYLFKLYALDKELSLPIGASKQELQRSMKESILAEAVLVGTYERK